MPPTKKKPIYTPLDEEFFEQAGMQLLGRPIHGSEVVRLRRFRSSFGCSPKVVAHIWNTIDPYEDKYFESYKGLSPNHLLWSLLFLKVYSTEAQHAVMVAVDEKTFRKWSWLFVEEIASLLPEVVSLSVWLLDCFMIAGFALLLNDRWLMVVSQLTSYL
jgi:hypothetical protein